MARKEDVRKEQKILTNVLSAATHAVRASESANAMNSMEAEVVVAECGNMLRSST